ncbi:hypothetical protein K290105B7_24640 [Anaerostipes caccae]|nr:hypothetical protein ANCC_30130 [Anaerostipes caccae L1-92]
MRIFLPFLRWIELTNRVFMRFIRLLKGGKCKKILSKNLLQNLPLAIVDVWKYNQYNGIIDKRLSDMNH